MEQFHSRFANVYIKLLIKIFKACFELRRLPIPKYLNELVTHCMVTVVDGVMNQLPFKQSCIFNWK